MQCLNWLVNFLDSKLRRYWVEPIKTDFEDCSITLNLWSRLYWFSFLLVFLCSCEKDLCLKKPDVKCAKFNTFPLYLLTQNEGHEFLIRVIQTKLGQKFTPNSQLLPFIASFTPKKQTKQVSKSVKFFFLLFLLINNEHRS